MSSVAVAGLPRHCFPAALTGLRKKLESLYRLRIAVDYAADSVAQAEAEAGLAAVRELFQTIAHHTEWAQ